MKAFDFAVAETREGALDALADGWRIKAGGIDLIDRLKERTEESDRLVGILKLDDLRGVKRDSDALEIGPLTTLAELGADTSVREFLPALADAASHAATPQIRNVATVGGNLLQRPRCWYFRNRDFPCLKKGGATCFAVDGENQFHALFGEGPCHIVHPSNLAPSLVAAGAEFHAMKGPDERRVIPADEFFLMPIDRMDGENALAADELLVGIRVPKAPEASAYIELRQKQSFDWPMSSCAVALVAGRWNVVLGHVAPIPWRARAAEELLAKEAGDRIDDSLAERAAEDALEGAEPMRHNAWRLDIARAAVRRALIAAGKETAA